LNYIQNKMTRTKEIGYDLISPMWHQLSHIQQLWSNETVETKDKIVNETGKLAEGLVLDHFISFVKKDKLDNKIDISELQKVINIFLDNGQ